MRSTAGKRDEKKRKNHLQKEGPELTLLWAGWLFAQWTIGGRTSTGGCSYRRAGNASQQLEAAEFLVLFFLFLSFTAFDLLAPHLLCSRPSDQT